jgi:uncharacterized protein (TIGR03000 family)
MTYRSSAPHVVPRTEIPSAGAEAAVATMLELHLPEEAVVYIDGYRTKSTGTHRRYSMKALQPGQMVTCLVRAELVRDGRTLGQSKSVELRAGQPKTMSFDFQPIATSLELVVPPDARVYLAGIERPGEGPVRRFTSTRLAAGERVSNYPVRVSVLRHGQPLSQEQAVSLQSGDSKTLRFQFDQQPAVAALE